MPLLRISLNGRKLDFSGESRLPNPNPRCFLYREPKAPWPSFQGENGKVKVYSREEIEEYERRTLKTNA